jgi:hypothetical protein
MEKGMEAKPSETVGGGELVVQLCHHFGELLVFPVAAGEHALGDGDVLVRGLVAGQAARVDGDGG